MRGQIEAYFDAAFTAPDGIKRLRELILTLAVQGKLTDQRDSDEPASELLKKIAAEKKKLEKEGKIKKQKPLPPVADDEKPYTLPKGWEWVRLNELCRLITDGAHHTPIYTEEGIPFISVKNISSGVLSFDHCRFISTHEHTTLIKRCNPEIGDVLFTKIGTTGIAVEITTDIPFSIFVSVALLKILNKYLSPSYITLLLNSPLVRQYSAAGTEGVGNKNLVLKKIINFVLPLPPLAEQQRIVERVNALMARCDALEAMHKEQEHKRNSARAAAMHALTMPQGTTDPALAFNRNWGFLARHFEQLFTTKQDIAELRKTILQLAVMGKLTDHHQSDEPASELLKKIAAEKKKLEKEGKIKKQKPLPPVADDEKPYALPKGWEWVRLGSVGEVNPRNKADDSLDAAFIPMASIEAAHSDRHSFEIKSWGEIKKGFTHLAEGDIGLAKITPCFENRKSCVFLGLPNSIGAGTTELHIFRNSCSAFISQFALCYLKSPIYIQSAMACMTGTAGQQRVPTNFFASFPIPLPPLAEQQRIVERVNSLMALCDTLEERMEARTQTQSHLLDAVVATA